MSEDKRGGERNRATALAMFSPSMADETMPPAYPAPSPAGNRPGTWGCIPVFCSRGILSGELVRLSTARTLASLVTKPFIFLSNTVNADLRLWETSVPRMSSSRWLIIPGIYEEAGRVAETLSFIKSVKRWVASDDSVRKNTA